MNKFFFALFVIVISTRGVAFCNIGFLLSENDTLNKQNFDSLSFKIYTSPGGGFVSGNNAYLDQSKVQEFHAGNVCNIYAVIINFGHKVYSSLNDSSYVGINFYHLNGTGKNTLSASAICPGNIFFKDSIKLADIDTTNGNILNYSSPLFTDSNFAIGIDFDQLNVSDTVALFTNKDGDAGTREQSWEQDLSGNWFSLKYNWPLNVDYAIFPIVNTSVGINMLSSEDQSFTISPNPAQTGLINISVPNSLITNVQVYTSSLQLVASEIITKNEFNTTVKFDVLNKGIYFVKIKTKDSISLEKLIVN